MPAIIPVCMRNQYTGLSGCRRGAGKSTNVVSAIQPNGPASDAVSEATSGLGCLDQALRRERRARADRTSAGRGPTVHGRTAPSKVWAYQSVFIGIFWTVRPVRGASMM